MSVRPSCPVMLIHDDDAFRKALIAALDRKHFTVTYTTDGGEALKTLREKSFRVVVLGVDLESRRGLDVLDYLRANRSTLNAGVIILGDPNPELRSYAAAADETLLKPVDPDYVADRASTYCA